MGGHRTQAKYEFHEAEWSAISATAKDLISKLLVVDPKERLNMQQLLEHPWCKHAVVASRAQIANGATTQKRGVAAEAAKGSDATSLPSAKPSDVTATRTSDAANGQPPAAADAPPLASGQLTTTVETVGSKKGAHGTPRLCMPAPHRRNTSVKVTLHCDTKMCIALASAALSIAGIATCCVIA